MEECVSLHISPVGNAAIGISGEEDYSVNVEGEEYSVCVSAICEILHFLNASVQKVELSWDAEQAVFRLLSDTAWTVSYNDADISIESNHEVGSSTIVLYSSKNEELDKATNITFSNRHGETLTLPVVHIGRREEFLTRGGNVLEMTDGNLLVIK